MKTNLLKALSNISRVSSNQLKAISRSTVRANSMGDALEVFITDSFCGVPGTINDATRDAKYSQAFSYLANQNNPPDAILRKGDALEIKKLASLKSHSIALNSSYPKSHLYSNSSLITASCRNCERGWRQKDIIYCVGNVVDKKLKLLVFVYGDCYAASRSVYERVYDGVKNGIAGTGLELSQTRELGRINRVDPLGITYLRIRGMWGIRTPANVFKDKLKFNPGDKLTVAAIMRSQKYSSFPMQDRQAIKQSGFDITDIKIKNPDNPAKLLDAKLLVMRRRI